MIYIIIIFQVQGVATKETIGTGDGKVIATIHVRNKKLIRRKTK